MESYKKLFSNTMIFALSNVLAKVILSMLLPLYTRMLTSAEYGIAELLTTISQLVVPVFSLSIQDAVFRYSMDGENKPENVLKSSLIIVLLGSVMIFLFSETLKWYKPLFAYKNFFCAISFLTMLRSILSLYIKAIDKTIIFSIDNIIYNIFLASFNIIFLVGIKMKLNGYFYAMILSNTISIVFLILSGKILYTIQEGTVCSSLLKEMIIYSLPLIINSISWGLTHLTDKLMITKYCSISETGIYSAASKVPALLSLITGVFSQAWAISAIQGYKGQKNSRFYDNVFFITHFGTIILALLIFTVNNIAVPFALGKEFEDAAMLTPILLTGTVFLGYSNFYSPIFSAMKKSKQIMSSAFIGMILNVLLNAILIPEFGTKGACIATMISYMFIALYRMTNCSKYIKVDIEIKKTALSNIILFIAMISVVFDVNGTIISAIGILFVIAMYYSKILGYIRCRR